MSIAMTWLAYFWTSCRTAWGCVRRRRTLSRRCTNGPEPTTPCLVYDEVITFRSGLRRSPGVV